MKREVERAIQLRQDGEHQKANDMLVKLAKDFPEDAHVQFQCAWSFDVLGKEAEAVPFYEAAIELGLSGKALEGAIVGLGSTYRTLGEYEKSKAVFEKGRAMFPGNRAIQVFYSMTLYNLSEHSEAMEVLLKCLVETTSNEDVLGYKKAIAFYADKLDEVWE